MKLNNEKGFTLIELLAIIVILAIIAVITVPIILNIIDEARKGAEKNSVIGYGKAVELAYTQYLFEKSAGTTDSENMHIDNDSTNLAAHKASGKTIAITIDGAAKNLKVDFDGDDVLCQVVTGQSTNYNNTITSGIVSLQNCKVNGNETTTYSYTGGKATTPSASTSS